MKQKNLSVLKIVLIVLTVEVVLSGMYYLLVYDKNKPFMYNPKLSRIVLEEEIKNIEPMTEEISGEIMITQDDFKGILIYGCSKKTSDEISESFGYLDSDIRYTHIVFPDDSYEIYVRDVQYEDIIDAWQYGWWDYQGNMYARRYGKEAAKDKPNYRYYYHLKSIIISFAT